MTFRVVVALLRQSDALLLRLFVHSLRLDERQSPGMCFDSFLPMLSVPQKLLLHSLLGFLGTPRPRRRQLERLA